MYMYGNPCADPESFVRGGPTLTLFFVVVVVFFLGGVVDEGREDQILLKAGHHQPSS